MTGRPSRFSALCPTVRIRRGGNAGSTTRGASSFFLDGFVLSAHGDVLGIILDGVRDVSIDGFGLAGRVPRCS